MSKWDQREVQKCPSIKLTNINRLQIVIDFKLFKQTYLDVNLNIANHTIFLFKITRTHKNTHTNTPTHKHTQLTCQLTCPARLCIYTLHILAFWCAYRIGLPMGWLFFTNPGNRYICRATLDHVHDENTFPDTKTHF